MAAHHVHPDHGSPVLAEGTAETMLPVLFCVDEGVDEGVVDDGVVDEGVVDDGVVDDGVVDDGVDNDDGSTSVYTVTGKVMVRLAPVNTLLAIPQPLPVDVPLLMATGVEAWATEPVAW